MYQAQPVKFLNDFKHNKKLALFREKHQMNIKIHLNAVLRHNRLVADVMFSQQNKFLLLRINKVYFLFHRK